MNDRLLEVCVDNYESAVNALHNGAGRLELCCALSEGGLTPTPGLLKQVQNANPAKVPVFCMLRCRGSNFVYTDEEMEIMVEDVRALKLAGANGFVFGALLDNGYVDLKKCRQIVKACYPLPVTFHRAFDVCKNPLINLETIIDVGFTRVLTSGQKASADEGVQLIKDLMKRAGDRLIVMPGGGITRHNIKTIVEETGALEYHGSFSIVKNEDEALNMKIADPLHVAEVVQILKD